MTIFARPTPNSGEKKGKRQRLKNCLALLILALLILPTLFSTVHTVAAAEKEEDAIAILKNGISEQLAGIDTSELEAAVREMTKEQAKIFGADTFADKLERIINGDFSENYNSAFSAILSIFFSGVIKLLPVFAGIVGIAVLSSLLNNLKSGKTPAAYIACFGAAVLSAGYVIAACATAAKGAIASMSTQMQVSFPVLLTLMSALGNTASAAVYQPVVLILTNLVAKVMSGIIMPLFLFSFALAAAGNLTTSVRLEKLSAFLQSLAKWIIGFIFTIFMAMLAVQGITAGVYDGVSVKTARYAISRSIPIIGGYLSDGFNLILAGTMLIKNALGYASILLIAAQLLSPVLYIAAAALLMKLTAGIVEPLAGGGFSDFLAQAAKSLSMLNITLIAVGFMYFITLMLIISTGNSVLYT